MPKVKVKFYYYDKIIPIVGHIGMHLEVDNNESDHQVWHIEHNLSNTTYTEIEFTIHSVNSNIEKTLSQIWELEHHSIIFNNCAHNTVKSLEKLGILENPPTGRLFLRPYTAARISCNCALRVIEDQRLEFLRRPTQEEDDEGELTSKMRELIKKEKERIEMQITRERCSHWAWGVTGKKQEVALLKTIFKKRRDHDCADEPLDTTGLETFDCVALLDLTTHPKLSSTTQRHLVECLKYIPTPQQEHARVQLAISRLRDKSDKLKKEKPKKSKPEESEQETHEDPNIQRIRDLATSLGETTRAYFTNPTTTPLLDTCQQQIDDASPLLQFELLKMFIYTFIAPIARRVASETTLRRFSLFQDPPSRVIFHNIMDQINAVAPLVPS